MRASRHRRDMTMTVLLLTIVMVFILCNTARVACNLYEAYQVNNVRNDLSKTVAPLMVCFLFIQSLNKTKTKL